MAVYVAILFKRYIRLILDGRKTIESRLTRTQRAPYCQIEVSETIFFKASSGPYMVKAVADQVTFYDNLTANRLHQLYRRYHKAVCADNCYWRLKHNIRYTAFIQLKNIEPTSLVPALKPSTVIAWFILESEPEADRIDVQLTGGAITNHYLRLSGHVGRCPGDAIGGKTIAHAVRPIELLIPDEHIIATDIVAGSMIRWRGWLTYYRQYHMLPGDVVRFVPIGRRRYRVSFIRNQNMRHDHAFTKQIYQST